MIRQNFLVFTIPGEPVAFARSNSNGRVRFTPKKQRSHAGVIKQFAQEAMNKYKNGEPTSQPLAVSITVTYLQPKSWSAKKKAATIFKTSKPDVDNLAKLVMDGCNQLVWVDDAQIAQLTVQKAYSTVASTTVKVDFLSGDAE